MKVFSANRRQRGAFGSLVEVTAAKIGVSAPRDSPQESPTDIMLPSQIVVAMTYGVNRKRMNYN